MFLYILDKEEGKAFMELAIIAMEKTNDKICDKAIFDTYLAELGISDFKPSRLSFDAILKIISDSKKEVKRSIILEICGLLHSAKGYGPKSEDWVYCLAEKMNIPHEEAERLIRWSNDFSEFLGIGLMYINAK